MQNWIKVGLIYGKHNYNAVPIAYFISSNIIRIFFSSRNDRNKSFPVSLDYDLSQKAVIAERTIDIPFGEKGMFDEDGIMPTALLEKDGQLLLYYIGWNLGASVPFRNSVGLMVSEDKGLTFRKYSKGPILDRSIYDKCFVASNCVLEDNGIFKMFYLSCDKWEETESGVFRHFYNIKYAESNDAINWQRQGKIAIDYKYKNEYAISTPRVIKENSQYKMWYSYRGGLYSEQYRIGYAESEDGETWIRKDENILLEPSKEGWDSEMVCYPFLFDFEGNHYMLYNGNGYGKTGIGLAKLEKGNFKS